MNGGLAGLACGVAKAHGLRTPERRAAAALWTALTTTKTPAAARNALAGFTSPDTRKAALTLLTQLETYMTAVPVPLPERKQVCLSLTDATNGLKLRALERCGGERLPGFMYCGHHVGECVSAYRKLTGEPAEEIDVPPWVNGELTSEPAEEAP